jgi:hypothetical protein
MTYITEEFIFGMVYVLILRFILNGFIGVNFLLFCSVLYWIELRRLLQ